MGSTNSTRVEYTTRSPCVNFRSRLDSSASMFSVDAPAAAPSSSASVGRPSPSSSFFTTRSFIRSGLGASSLPESSQFIPMLRCGRSFQSRFSRLRSRFLVSLRSSW